MSDSKSNNAVSSQSHSTGPKSPEGKAIASKNATKAGIFSKGYLPWEDQATKQLEIQSLAQEWGVSTLTGIHFLRDIEQANLAQERLMYAERLAVEGAMQSAQLGEEFAVRANLDLTTARNLPSWYFLEDDGGNKKHAHYLDRVYEQAEHLKNHYSDQLVAQAQTRYPQLYQFVMERYAANQSFVMVMAKEYQQRTPILNLVAIMNGLSEKSRFHLLWAQDSVRYQMIIDGLRAEKMLEVLDFDKSNRYLTSFQNRRLRALQGLEALERRQEILRLQAGSKNTLQPNEGAQTS
jgi:hypothetical protein